MAERKVCVMCHPLFITQNTGLLKCHRKSDKYKKEDINKTKIFSFIYLIDILRGIVPRVILLKTNFLNLLFFATSIATGINKILRLFKHPYKM